MYLHIFTEVKCEMSKAKVFCPFVQVPLQPFFFCDTTRRLPADGWLPQWRVLRCTQQQGPQWLTEGKSGPWVKLCATRNVYRCLNTLEKSRDHQVCADLAPDSVYGTWTGGNGALRTTRDRGQSVSFAGWVKPAKITWRNSSALLEPRDVTWKICWLSFSPCFYESADPNPAVIQGPWKCMHSFGQPTSIDLMEMRYGFIMHGICTSKTASYIQFFLPCNCIQCYSLSFTCLAFWLCKNM